MPREQRSKRKKKSKLGRRPLALNVSVRLGRAIRRKRAAKGWSLEELARRTGLTPNYIGAIELGGRHRSPSLEVVLSIADALGTELGELLGLRGKNLEPIGMEAASLVQAMPETTQAVVMPLLRFMALEASSKGRASEQTSEPPRNDSGPMAPNECAS
jgi:transcriptional regulator with XRE-family HTH domain